MQRKLPKAPFHPPQPPPNLVRSMRGERLLHTQERATEREHLGHREGPRRLGEPSGVQPGEVSDREKRQDRSAGERFRADPVWRGAEDMRGG